MGYRIELSTVRKGVVQVHFPGRVIALEAREHAGPIWEVAVVDDLSNRSGTVAVWAEGAGDAVWRVAQATVRAVTGLAGTPGRDDGDGNDKEPTTNDASRGEMT